MTAQDFASEFLKNNFETVCETVEDAAKEYKCHDVYSEHFEVPFREGLKAGDDEATRQVYPGGVDEAAEKHCYSENDPAEYVAFKLGYLTAVAESLDTAVSTILDLEDYTGEYLRRVVESRQQAGEDVSEEDFLTGGASRVQDVVLLSASYVE